MRSSSRRKRRPLAEINVVPYIDVMLVLVVIFMVTAPLVTQGVKVDLPTAHAKQLDKDSKSPIIASIDNQGRYYLDYKNSREQALSLSKLAVLVEAYRRVQPHSPVVVRGDGDVPYKSVIQLMVALQNAGVPSVGLMTQPPESQ
ncbi:protein TolR [Dongshaea marina]|uniref:protein TolR n=1 Tax=Dongshaea marina TaxID=2047966 RepID=UPI000D3E3299|nr:protein TolR [Dongshaea marina]